MSNGDDEDVEFELLKLEGSKIGDVFKLKLNITNKSGEIRFVKTLMTVSSMFYTGVKANLVKKEQEETILQPHESK